VSLHLRSYYNPPFQEQANLTYGMNTSVPPPGWGNLPDLNQYAVNTGVPPEAPITNKSASAAEKEVQQLLQGCTFTKDQYDHILKMVQQKSKPSASMCKTANTSCKAFCV